MKKQAFHGLVACVLSMALLSACEKMVVSEDGGSGGKGGSKGNVVLRVSQFEQKPFDAPTRGDVNDYCTKLCFHIYDAEGTRIEYVNQKQETEGFGTASFSLPEGHYTLVVVGHSGSTNPSFSANEKVSISGKGLGDTFWCCEELEVKSDGLEKSLELKRIVSLVRFIPTDENPATLDQMVIKYKGSRGTFNGLTGFGSTDVNQTVDMEVSPDDTQFEFYMIPSALENTLSAEISTYSHSATGSVIPLTQKTIDQIPVKRNCVTICRGNLFDGKSSERSVFITVSIDGEWDEDINLTF
jgi:hypothetical protein